VTLQVKISPCSSVTKTLQIFIAVHSQIHSHFNSERHLVSREIYMQRRSATLAGSQTIAAQTEVRFGLRAPGGDNSGLV